MENSIAQLVERVDVFSVNEKGGTLHKYFEQHTDTNGVVIVDENDYPIGLIMRNHFYQKIGTQFGFAIYLNRPIELMMKKEILVLDIAYELAKFGYVAMNRASDDVYDFVIITKDDCYEGVVSISRFLMVMSEMKEREISLLSEQQRILKEAHDKEKQFRMQIEMKNRAIKNLMDHAEQGFLSFGEDLRIDESYSKVCDEIFNRPIGGLPIEALLGDYLTQEARAHVVDTFHSIFSQERIRRAAVYIRLLPEELVINERHIAITYKIISFKAKKELMVILTDVTDKKALEKKNLQEKNNMKLVLAAINHKEEISASLREAEAFFESAAIAISENERPLQEMFRAIHTMKGDFALRSFHNTAIKLHKMEDVLAKMIAEGSPNTREALLTLFDGMTFDRFVSEDLGIINAFLGEGFFQSGNQVTIHYNRIQHLEKLVQERFNAQDAAYIMDSVYRLTYPTINEVLWGYGDYTKLIALKLNKQIEDIVISGDTVYIDPKQFSGVTKALIHVFRNIADHGIELPEERAEKDKPPMGNIRCHVEKREAVFTVSISDDGKGIDPRTIGQKAVASHLLSAEEVQQLTDEALVNFIFEDNFSTRETVSMLSGRGVGLASVKGHVEALGGTIRVRSKIDAGTEFFMVLPLL